MAAWLAYGVLTSDAAVIVTNLVTIVFITPLCLLKIVDDRRGVRVQARVALAE